MARTFHLLIIIYSVCSFSFFKDLLPSYFSSEWSFAHCRVPSETRYIATFSRVDQNILVVCADGSYYKFTVDFVNGGECKREIYRRLLVEET